MVATTMLRIKTIRLSQRVLGLHTNPLARKRFLATIPSVPTHFMEWLKPEIKTATVKLFESHQPLYPHANKIFSIYEHEYFYCTASRLNFLTAFTKVPLPLLTSENIPGFIKEHRHFHDLACTLGILATCDLATQENLNKLFKVGRFDAIKENIQDLANAKPSLLTQANIDSLIVYYLKPKNYPAWVMPLRQVDCFIKNMTPSTSNSPFWMDHLHYYSAEVYDDLPLNPLNKSGLLSQTHFDFLINCNNIDYVGNKIRRLALSNSLNSTAMTSIKAYSTFRKTFPLLAGVGVSLAVAATLFGKSNTKKVQAHDETPTMGYSPRVG